MGFKNTALNLLFNPIGIAEEVFKFGGAAPKKDAGAASGPLPMPQAPDVSAVQDQANKNIQRKKASASKTVYTSPLGLSGEAQVINKTLLGQ